MIGGTDALAPLATPTGRLVLAAVGVLLVAVIGRELRRVPPRLLVLMAAAFIDMLGLFFVVPLVPFYVEQYAGDGVTLPLVGEIGIGVLNGLMVASYTIAQTFSAPRWGQLSDRIGRRAVLMIAVTASACAFGILAIADSLWLLLLSRLVQGLGGGTVGVIQAYVADTVAPKERARALGWLSASTNLGVAIGPALGALLVALGDVDLLPGDAVWQLGGSAPGLGAALVCLANLAFIRMVLPESRPRTTAPRTTPVVTARAAAWTAITHIGAPASRMLWTYGIVIGASQGIHTVLAFFLDDRLGIGEDSIGYVYMYIGAISMLARILLLGRAVDRIGEGRLASYGIALIAAGLCWISFVDSVGDLAGAVALLPLGASFTFPCVSALLSQIVHDDDRGLYLGLQQSFGNASRLCAPLLYGWAYDSLGHASPFRIGSLLVLATLALALGLPRRAR